MMNIIFISPPAAGKGTVSEFLSKKYGYVHISTGNLLREEIKNNTDLGKKIDELIKVGSFVSDESMTLLLERALLNLNKPFILDGYPRNIDQAEILNKLLSSLKIDNYVAIYLDIEKDEALKRATGRLICPSCKISFHKNNENLKPKVEYICDRCHEQLIQRSDDTKEVFDKRYETFLDVTYPLVDYYKNSDKLVIVDSNEGSERAFQEIEKLIVEA